MRSLPKKYVATGSYVVSETKRQVLEALLGSCAGLAVIDKAAGVGGMYHILLSGHPGNDTHYGDEVYASSGMPKFLKALQEAGCAPERMEAVLAGGALMGKLSRLDMQLDIGGRTIEVVQRILREWGIPLIHSETGGFSGLRLQLNLRTFECRIEPAYTSEDFPVGEEAAVEKISAEDLNRAIGLIKPIPQVALKIIRTLQSDEYDTEDIAVQIRHDQVISAKVLNICNSAYIGAKKEIQSINQALVVLGSRIVVQLILSSALEGFFASFNKGYSLSRGGLYHHAVSAAIVSEHVSRLTGNSDPEIAYTAGLLHDIGKVLLDQYVGSAKPQFYRKIYSDGDELLDVEKSILGINHAEAGARLAELWSFPDPLRDVVAYHGQPEQALDDPVLTHIVYLANLLLSRFDACRELENIGTEKLVLRLRRLGLDSNSLPELIGRIPWKSLYTPGYF
ncbi:MAG: HDOD domain-containing protein [Acidobacteria bacterium]|nr:HDOD domain-containing protein [Acidobacteriota bacterium]